MAGSKKILLLSDTSSADLDGGGFVSGLWAIRQYIDGGGATTNNFELVSVSSQAPAYTSKEVYTGGGPTYAVGATINNSIIDPPTGPIRELTIVGPTTLATDGTSWIVSFGGSNITNGPVVYNLQWDPSVVFGGTGANQAEAGDGYLLVYDSLISKWRIY